MVSTDQSFSSPAGLRDHMPPRWGYQGIPVSPFHASSSTVKRSVLTKRSVLALLTKRRRPTFSNAQATANRRSLDSYQRPQYTETPCIRTKTAGQAIILEPRDGVNALKE